MGLDMYLYRHNYVKNWSHYAPEEQHTITVKRGNSVREDIKPDRITFIAEEVAYWRKFNALHAWFVNNCGNGEDNCQQIYVSQDNLIDLLSTLKEVKEALNQKDEDKIQELLPPQSGFFFGSTEVDQYYKEDVEDTIEKLESILSEGSSEDYYYQASW